MRSRSSFWGMRAVFWSWGLAPMAAPLEVRWGEVSVGFEGQMEGNAYDEVAEFA